MNRWYALAIFPIIGIFAALLVWPPGDEPRQEPIPEIERPDFAAIQDVKAKKETFFGYMLPFIRQANQEIREERALLLQTRDRILNTAHLSDNDRETIERLADKYLSKNDDPFTRESIRLLIRRVDTIPASLVLAQAAHESGWGTARFAKHGNNYFGLWCWSEDCGLVPRERDDGAQHEVKGYDTPLDSVRNYMLTLNSHAAYQTFRELRETQRHDNEPLAGPHLAEGLLAYSERREDYVEELRAMMRINDLKRFNQPAMSSQTAE